jgi:uncharacterized protein YcnI
LKTIKKILLTTVLITASSTVAANAHVEFDPDHVAPGKQQTLSLVVPHDCSAKTKTTEIKLQLPSNLNRKSFSAGGVFQHGKVLSSWTQKINTSGGKSYLDIKGPGVMAGPDMGKNALTIKFNFMTPAAVGTQLKFPTVQYCTGGLSVSWVQPRPADGADPAEMAKPVPVLNLK